MRYLFFYLIPSASGQLLAGINTWAIDSLTIISMQSDRKFMTEPLDSCKKMLTNEFRNSKIELQERNHYVVVSSLDPRS